MQQTCLHLTLQRKQAHHTAGAKLHTVGEHMSTTLFSHCNMFSSIKIQTAFYCAKPIVLVYIYIFAFHTFTLHKRSSHSERYIYFFFNDTSVGSEVLLSTGNNNWIKLRCGAGSQITLEHILLTYPHTESHTQESGPGRGKQSMFTARLSGSLPTCTAWIL